MTKSELITGIRSVYNFIKYTQFKFSSQKLNIQNSYIYGKK